VEACNSPPPKETQCKPHATSPHALAAGAQHRKTAIVGWLVFVIAAFMVGKSIGTENVEPGAAGAGESGAAQQTTLDAFPKKSEGMVLIQGRPGTASPCSGSSRPGRSPPSCRCSCS
jgi:hypothetical protein